MDTVKKVLGVDPLPTRKLGKDGPNVTAIGFGLMGLSAFYGTPKPDSERLPLLDKAYAMGEWHWDSGSPVSF